VVPVVTMSIGAVKPLNVIHVKPGIINGHVGILSLHVQYFVIHFQSVLSSYTQLI
jgi:hypothetical protein